MHIRMFDSEKMDNFLQDMLETLKFKNEKVSC